jgi:arylsulfatase A-like enzyme
MQTVLRADVDAADAPSRIRWAKARARSTFSKAGPTPEDDWDLGQYLNAIREADMQIGRLIDALHSAGWRTTR